MFLIGILLDIFEGNIGLNNKSLVFIVFISTYVHKIVIPKNSIDIKDKLTLQTLGLKTFSVYYFYNFYSPLVFIFFRKLF